MTLAVNPLTNRITGQSYDANGNLLSLPAGGTGTYDAENRLVAVPGATYGYDGSNKRIWQWTGSVDGYGFGNASGLQLYLYGLDGKQLGTYVTSIYTNNQVAMAPLLLDSVGTLNVYFLGKKVGTGQPGALVAFQQDRLGSSVKTYPYGEEKVPNGVDGWKFATYLRDTATNLDYADQRFYANSQGRFLTPDPFAASGGASSPASWNRYAYVEGDPVNYRDPAGLVKQEIEGEITTVFRSTGYAFFDREDTFATEYLLFAQNRANSGVGRQMRKSNSEVAEEAFDQVKFEIERAVLKDSVFSVEQLDCIGGIETGRTWNPNVQAANGRVGLYQFNKANWEASGTSIPWNGGSSARDPYTSTAITIGFLYRKLGSDGVANPTQAAIQEAIDKFGEHDGRYGQAVMDCAKALGSGDFLGTFGILYRYNDWKSKQ